MIFAKITIIGNLGGDPELRYTPQGTAVANFSIATTEGKKNKNGEWENITTWFKCTTWGKQAENCAKNLEKGSPTYLEGRLSEEKWQDKDGNERTSLHVNVSDVQFLEKKEQAMEATVSGENKSSGKKDKNEDDIPF